MRIKTTIANYDGSTIELSSGFQLAVFQGNELSGIQTEMRHGTLEGENLKNTWYAGIFKFDAYEDGWSLAVKSEGFTSREDTVNALNDAEGIAVNFDPYVWLSHRNGQNNIQIIRAFGS